jgi:signal transduction histidine kinase
MVSMNDVPQHTDRPEMCSSANESTAPTSEAPTRSGEARTDSVSEQIMEHTEFFSTLSHELRTPLAAIKGFSQSLLSHWDAFPDDRKQHHVELIFRSTVRLERLVNDLALSSRLVDGVPLNCSSVDVAAAVAQAIDEAQALYPDRVIRVAPAAMARHVWADQERLLQVLVNLLDNAAKYSPPSEPISVRWSEVGSGVRLEVCDAGTSLTVDEQQRLFTRYGRLHSVKEAGSGLGLYICKGLVEAMGGTIGATAGMDGSGNRFWFTIP